MLGSSSTTVVPARFGMLRYTCIIRVLSESGTAVQKKLTITLEQSVYQDLHTVIGRRRISRLIENLVRLYVLRSQLDA